MKIKLGQLRKIIAETITEAYGSGTNLGYIIAYIDGDRRYADSLHVDYDASKDVVVVRVEVSSPAGGMDSFTDSVSSEDYRREIPADDIKQIMDVLKNALANDKYNFKRYGKPTKNFYWNDDSVGPSMANLKANLAAVRGG